MFSTLNVKRELKSDRGKQPEHTAAGYFRGFLLLLLIAG